MSVLPHPAAQGSAEQACRAWLQLTRRIKALHQAWSRTEERLAREFGWYQLSSEERSALPAGGALTKIDNDLDAAYRSRDALLAKTHGLPARTSDAMVWKLLVALELVPSCDNAEGHAVLSSLLADLTSYAPNR